MTPATHDTPMDDYAANHQHPANRVLHGVGIPVIAGYGIAALLRPHQSLRFPRRPSVTL